MAAELAKEAMELDPDNRSYISDYCNAMGSFIPDWNGRNHHVLIRELKENGQATRKKIELLVFSYC